MKERCADDIINRKQNDFGAGMQMRRCLDRGGAENGFSAYDAPMSPFRHSQLKETKSGHKPSVATLFEQGNQEFGNIV